MNPRKMQQMMKQMGISVEQIEDVQEVIIKTSTREIVFNDAEVTIMDARGIKSYQIVGTPVEKSTGSKVIPEDDVKLVMEQANCDEVSARKALEEASGDLAEAIMRLSKK